MGIINSREKYEKHCKNCKKCKDEICNLKMLSKIDYIELEKLREELLNNDYKLYLKDDTINACNAIINAKENENDILYNLCCNTLNLLERCHQTIHENEENIFKNEWWNMWNIF
tara:strand:+ start:1909 stop:2250 length:342 start_codon:yes stop_codon:yes gene_type:complete